MKGDVWKDLALGALPAAIVNRCLRLELTAGGVMFFAHAQKHAFGEKPDRHAICGPHLQDVIAGPTHIGQQPGYEADGFDLVRVIDKKTIVLVGVGIRPIKKLHLYTVRTVYPITMGALERRIRIGTTIVV